MSIMIGTREEKEVVAAELIRISESAYYKGIIGSEEYVEALAGFIGANPKTTYWLLSDKRSLMNLLNLTVALTLWCQDQNLTPLKEGESKRAL